MPLDSTIRLLFCLALLGFAGPGAARTGAEPPQGAPAAHPELLVSAGWLAAHLHDPNLVILCIAQNPEFLSAGHIPGAACLYWMNLLESAANSVLKPEAELRRIFETLGAARNAHTGARVVTYCRTGMQSSMDYFVAKYLGYEAAMYPASFYEWGRSDAPVLAEK